MAAWARTTQWQRFLAPGLMRPRPSTLTPGLCARTKLIDKLSGPVTQTNSFVFSCHRLASDRPSSERQAVQRYELLKRPISKYCLHTSVNATGGSGSSQGIESQPVNDNATTDGFTTHKPFGMFMLLSAVSVMGIVVWGGLTRLTESGLSITQWRPVTGTFPPLNESDWESEFTLYKASPEFQVLNSKMDLDEFKKIYFMEWTHRMWGRFIGVSYLVGLTYFATRRRPANVLSRRMFYGASTVLLGIGAQGVVGWWMVASGLKDDLFAPGSHPRVSHYRLVTHLGMAFCIYAAMFAMGSQVIRNRKFLAQPQEALRFIEALQTPAMVRYRRLATGLLLLVFTTAMSGGLVAGLDAGLIYNEFPMMGSGIIPPVKELFDKFYSRRPDLSDLWWRNMLENPATVQMNHRILATTTLLSVLSLVLYARTGRMAAVMPEAIKRATKALLHVTLLQVTLGITTLIYLVPVPLAALHQAGSLLVFTGALTLVQRMYVPRNLAPVLKKRVLLTAPQVIKQALPHAHMAKGSLASMESVPAATGMTSGTGAAASQIKFVRQFNNKSDVRCCKSNGRSSTSHMML